MYSEYHWVMAKSDGGFFLNNLIATLVSASLSRIELWIM